MGQDREIMMSTYQNTTSFHKSVEVFAGACSRVSWIVQSISATVAYNTNMRCVAFHLVRTTQNDGSLSARVHGYIGALRSYMFILSCAYLGDAETIVITVYYFISMIRLFEPCSKLKDSLKSTCLDLFLLSILFFVLYVMLVTRGREANIQFVYDHVVQRCNPVRSVQRDHTMRIANQHGFTDRRLLIFHHAIIICADALELLMIKDRPRLVSIDILNGCMTFGSWLEMWSLSCFPPDPLILSWSRGVPRIMDIAWTLHD
mmetsp:Transcript_1890/g.3325  ORF Transcript_1890/g.3325 Transcript_1890/m.3325 type:complete len:260 (+) Transcript_1890:397-1176(+)